MRRWLLVRVVFAASAAPRSPRAPPGDLDAEGFRPLMERVALNRRHHGLVIVQLRGGRIARWREYQIESSLTFEEVPAASRF